MTTATKTVATDVAGQFDGLVDNLEERIWVDVQPVQDARKRLQATLSAGPALHGLVASLPSTEGVVRATYARLARGEAVDPDAFSAALAAGAATGDAMRFAAITTTSGNDSARNELAAAQHANQGAALAVLDQTVRELVGLARPLLAAEEVLAGTRRYDEIGQTQVAIGRAAVAHVRVRSVQMAVTSDPLDGDPSALLRVYGIVTDVRACLPGVVAMAAGLAAGHRPEVPDVNDAEAMLRFVCRGDLSAWCPTYPQARAAKAAFDQHVAGLRDEAMDPTRPDRDASDDPQVVVRGGIGRPPNISSR